MALTKFDVASAALVLIGAAPVTSFDGDSAESIACKQLYQGCVDNYLSLYPWRFATRTTQMNAVPAELEPPVGWRKGFVAPSGFKAIQNVVVNDHGIPFDRFENQVWCNFTGTDPVYAVHTYEPPIAWWPGYFETLVEVGLAHRLSFALSGKLDLAGDLGKQAEVSFRLGKNADSRQQTSRRFKVSGTRSIMEVRRA